MMLTGCPDSKHTDALTFDDWVGSYMGDAVSIINYADMPSNPDTLRCDSVAGVLIKAKPDVAPNVLYASFSAGNAVSGWGIDLGRIIYTGNSTLYSEPDPRSTTIATAIPTPRFGLVLPSLARGTKTPVGELTNEKGNLYFSVADTLDRVNEAGDSIPLITVRHEFRGAKVN